MRFPCPAGGGELRSTAAGTDLVVLGFLPAGRARGTGVGGVAGERGGGRWSAGGGRGRGGGGEIGRPGGGAAEESRIGRAHV